jgi:hypothetical protein
MKIIHIFTQEKTLTAIMYPEMFLKHFVIHPTEFLSSFHTTMRISHYKLYSIYIVIVCKYWYSVNVKGLLFNSNELTLGDHRYIFFLIYYVKLTRTRNMFPFLYKLTN